MTINVPDIVMEPGCPYHPSVKIKAGVTNDAYVEFYCRHCKKTYIFAAKIEADTDGKTVIHSKVVEKAIAI